MTTEITDDHVNPDVTFIDSANTTSYTTTGENRIRVDTSSAAVTITLASADATRDPEHWVKIYDDSGDAAANNITVNTEGSETIDPGGDSSKTISVDHAAFRFESNGTNWNQTGANVERESVAAGQIDTGEASTRPLAGHLFQTYPIGRLKSSTGSGSVTFPGSSADIHSIQLREPGNGSAAESSRAYDDITEFDPAIPYAITFRINNITIDNNSLARAYFHISDSPDADRLGASDTIAAEVRGDGEVRAVTKENGTLSTSSDTSQNNAYIAGLETVRLEWDGSSLTVITDDGSTEVSVSDSGNYPSGENLFLKVEAADADGAGAVNVDFDVTRIGTGVRS